MLGTVQEELDKITRCENQTLSLRTRFEADFDRWRNEEFKIPKKEGEWESYTTNRPSTDSNKLVNTLASAKVKLWIPITDEDKKKRGQLSKTEQFPYGAIALSDSILQAMPEAQTLHEAMSWDAPNRGWITLFCYLYEEGGKVVPYIDVWDTLNTHWISGAKGLIWAHHERYASIESIEDEYGIKVQGDTDGKVKVHSVVDKDEYGVICDNKYFKKEKHGLEHVPVFIQHTGGVRLVQNRLALNLNNDNIKFVGESCFANNRNIYDIESRMGSYLLTLAGRAAKTPQKFYFDSTKGGIPPDFESSPFEKGAMIPIDIGKGQDLKEGTPPELTQSFFSFFDYIQGRLSIGGQAPIAYGQINQALPAAGMNLLRHASMDNIKPFQLLIERAYVWLAHELVSQYKTGKFKKMEIQGIDGSNRIFKMQVKPDDIDPSWNFACQLIASFPQDDLSNMGMAVQASESKLLSKQTIRGRWLGVEDTDLEQQVIDREAAFEIHFLHERHLAALLADSGDKEGAEMILQDIDRLKQEMMGGNGKTPGIANQPGVASAMRPSADASAAIPQPPQASKLRNFLGRMGGGGNMGGGPKGV